ncbi:hypothetical protein G9A89_016233 [Geosiphon pyriformis]|nr:hypothetical protein G9A89_016233 [Geosiphon pyriformis]
MAERIRFRARASNYLKTKVGLNIALTCEEKTNSRVLGTDPNDLHVPLFAEPAMGNDSTVVVGDQNSLPIEALAEMEQQCILIPTYAFRDQNGALDEWTVRVRGWAYATRRTSRKRKIMMGVARRIMVKDDQQGKYLEDRFGMFLTKNLRDQEYTVKVIGLAHPSHMKIGGDPDSDDSSESGSNEADEKTLVESESGEDSPEEDIISLEKGSHPSPPTIHVTTNTGHFEGIIKISNDLVKEWISKRNKECISKGNKEYDGFGNHMRLLKLQARNLGNKNASSVLGYADLIDAEGISIISDIDDTIKETDISSGPRAIISNTFLKDSLEVSDMALRYLEWYQKGASIHYVSNSPWQLFPTLKLFFDEKNFPPGSAHLKFYNDLIKSITENTGQNKKAAIRQIIEDFPLRKFILIGDSGEIDMEIYSSIVTEFPKRILHIFIRDVSTKRLEAQPGKRSRSFPFITRRTSSGESFRLAKTMPNLHKSSPNECEDDVSLFTGSKNSSQTSTPSQEYEGFDFLSPLQIFQERVERIRKEVESFGTEFTLFKEGKDLLGHAKVDQAFEELSRHGFCTF